MDPAAGETRLTSTWIVLTLGDREAELTRAIASIERCDGSARILVVYNGVEPRGRGLDADVIVTPTNLGIPAARALAASRAETDIIVFLDDDAVAGDHVGEGVRAAFEADPTCGAVALRLVDENGATARRHVPRFGGRGAERGGDVALFLGGACAFRRSAYEGAGGYWGDLFYGHEEVELAWRLIDRGWTIRYLPDATVFHPRTVIGRHADGWRMTGRNRVMIARRTLPWPVAFVHTVGWLVLGTSRAPGLANRRAYLRGWLSGWTHPVDRHPIRWRTVWRLARLRRPPIL